MRRLCTQDGTAEPMNYNKVYSLLVHDTRNIVPISNRITTPVPPRSNTPASTTLVTALTSFLQGLLALRIHLRPFSYIAAVTHPYIQLLC